MNARPPALVCDARTRWIVEAVAGGARVWVDNVAGVVHCLELAGRQFPLVLAEDSADASYVASLLSAWPRYARDEVGRHLPGWQSGLAGAPLGGLAALMHLGGLGRAATLVNELVSTNLLPALDAAQWRMLREQALTFAPDRPLALRNVSEAVSPGLARQLAADGWWLVPARVVYTCDPADPLVRRRNNIKNDTRLLKRDDVCFVPPGGITPEDLPPLRALFRQLFLDKHSALNPDFSDGFFRLCQAHGYLELHALRHEARWVGVVGLLRREGWLTTPLLGYDLAAPQGLGLYRRLMAHSQRVALEDGLRLHMSSGAGAFKLARGGVPVLEYTAVYAAHLPRWRAAAVGAFVALLRRAAPPLLSRFG